MHTFQLDIRSLLGVYTRFAVFGEGNYTLAWKCSLAKASRSSTPRNAV